MVEKWAKSKLAVEIAQRVRPLLAGNDPDVQGAILAELTAAWILGHHPDIRADMLIAHYRATALMAARFAKSSDPWQDEADSKKATKQ